MQNLCFMLREIKKHKYKFLYLSINQILFLITDLITPLIAIDIAPLTVLFCNCPLADLVRAIFGIDHPVQT